MKLQKILGKTAVIIGGGMSGAAAAAELTTLGIKVKILEKESRLGGKIYSAREHRMKSGTPELGAMVMTCNYPAVDTVMKHKLKVTPIFPGETQSLNQIVMGNKTPSFYEKIKYATKFAWQNAKFAYGVRSYNAACANLQATPPAGQDVPFDQFCKEKGLDTVARFQKLWVPGMGYGDLKHNPSYRIMHYMGYGTMPSLATGTCISHNLLTVDEGYQTVVEKMVEGMDVETSVTIKKIERSTKGEGVTIYYIDASGKEICSHADYLVLTMSPYYWSDLNMELTETEQKCIQQLTCIPYSTAVVDIKDYPNKQLFIPEALDAKGFGHVGFISTKGEGRCVVYVNRDPADEKFSLDEKSPGRATMLKDLSKLGYNDVNILQTKDWPDYNAMIPWELGMKLEEQQGQSGTIYVGTYRPISFETVAAAENSSRQTIRRLFGVEKSNIATMKENLVRGYNFFFRLPMKDNEAENATQLIKPLSKL